MEVRYPYVSGCVLGSIAAALLPLLSSTSVGRILVECLLDHKHRRRHLGMDITHPEKAQGTAAHQDTDARAEVAFRERHGEHCCHRQRPQC